MSTSSTSQGSFHLKSTTTGNESVLPTTSSVPSIELPAFLLQSKSRLELTTEKPIIYLCWNCWKHFSTSSDLNSIPPLDASTQESLEQETEPIILCLINERGKVGASIYNLETGKVCA